MRVITVFKTLLEEVKDSEADKVDDVRVYPYYSLKPQISDISWVPPNICYLGFLLLFFWVRFK